eukprot:6199856-Pleurochrysis_carterae.AAC.1
MFYADPCFALNSLFRRWHFFMIDRSHGAKGFGLALARNAHLHRPMLHLSVSEAMGRRWSVLMQSADAATRCRTSICLKFARHYILGTMLLRNFDAVLASETAVRDQSLKRRGRQESRVNIRKQAMVCRSPASASTKVRIGA